MATEGVSRTARGGLDHVEVEHPPKSIGPILALELQPERMKALVDFPDATSDAHARSRTLIAAFALQSVATAGHDVRGSVTTCVAALRRDAN